MSMLSAIRRPSGDGHEQVGSSVGMASRIVGRGPRVRAHVLVVAVTSRRLSTFVDYFET